MTTLTLLGDLRILTATLIATLGATFLVHASPRSWPYVGWLAGSALAFGLTQAAFRAAELLQWLPAGYAGVLGAAISLAAWAAVVTGLRVHFDRQRSAAWQLFGMLAAAGLAMTLALHRMLASWAFAGPATVSALFAATAAWLLWSWRHDRWAGQLLLAAAFALHPVLLALALGEGMSVQQFRSLTPLPIAVGYVLVMTLILQRDARLLASELAERARAEQALQQLAASLDSTVQARTHQLEAVIQGLQSFTGMVSHDLRGPLGNTSSLADLARAAHEAGDAAGAARWLTLLRRETQRAVGMVDDLLTLANVDQGPVRRSPVAMTALVGDCVQSLELLYPGATQAVRFGDLPLVQADPGLLQHLVTNLLSNALKFGAGRAGLAIQVSARRNGGGWLFEVADNGPGFDPAQAGALFEPFARLAPSVAAGSGLGLTVVRRVAERHGGSVGAESQPGQGARFWWTLPDAA